MPRQFSEHSKAYLKQYFKTRYDNDPEFRRKANESNNVSRLRTRIIKKIDMLLLEHFASQFESNFYLKK